ncbi:oxidoreductase [Abeliophyllum distichum]|uniref:Oxidoreductase n=1 Tax=Abeliophyllum distichum TaxID=126358 RepID=A0ABD1SFH2_9LAMI
MILFHVTTAAEEAAAATEEVETAAAVVEVVAVAAMVGVVVAARSGCLQKLKKGVSAYPGIECSGQIIAVSAIVTQWKVGDQVYALVNRGGYAEEVVVPSGQLLSVPRSVSLEDAASLPVVVVATVVMTLAYLQFKLQNIKEQRC